MRPRTSSLVQELELTASLDVSGNPDGTAALARLEEGLTEGSAWALGLETERARLLRCIRDVAADTRAGRPRGEELTRLAGRLETTERELTAVKEVLRTLRLRHREVRTA